MRMSNLAVLFPLTFALTTATTHSHKTIHVQSDKRIKELKDVNLLECLSECRKNETSCRSIGIDVDDYYMERRASCFLLTTVPSKEDKEESGSNMNLFVTYPVSFVHCIVLFRSLYCFI